MNLLYQLSQLPTYLIRWKENFVKFKNQDTIVIKIVLSLIVSISICSFFNFSIQLVVSSIMTASFGLINQDKLTLETIKNNVIGSLLGYTAVNFLKNIADSSIMLILSIFFGICALYLLCVEFFTGVMFHNAFLCFVFNDAEVITNRIFSLIAGYLSFWLISLILRNEKEKTLIYQQIEEIYRKQRKIANKILKSNLIEDIDIKILENFLQKLEIKISKIVSDFDYKEIKNIEEFTEVVEDFIVFCNICTAETAPKHKVSFLQARITNKKHKIK